MPPPVEDDEIYDSASDGDFNPDLVLADAGSSSDDEDAAPRVKKAARKRVRDDDTLPDAELDSGDEATIQERKKKRRKAESDAAEADDEVLSDGEGGEGGFVKTRAQRRNEVQERRPLARVDGATIDVDALWAQMSSAPVGKPPEPPPAPRENPGDYIVIKRSTAFAGQVTTEERRVLKSSKEAQLYLAEQEALKKKEAEKEAAQAEAPMDDRDGPSRLPLRRPLKRPQRFEPNPSGLVKGLPAHQQLRWPRSKPAVSDAENSDIQGVQVRSNLAPATKLNTVDKSRHDWAGFVDKEGIADELDEYGKSKQNYSGRADFLNRTEHRREQERRAAKAKG
ncbi:BCNT-domain-containing protein [Trichodelitschia bisporula]|uniref:SWR1-complex protein 5 n=1 Tax=Trichodelitschia bisporula TaxID=703511 RepID=A0A6G1HKC5_9PEZI|nr:BCNT-domain-containing protein [Trichodelitschia bisporula]